MPRIHGPPLPHRPVDHFAIGMGRGPNGPPAVRPAIQHQTAPQSQQCPLPSVRQNPGPRQMEIRILDKACETRFGFPSLNVTQEGQELKAMEWRSQKSENDFESSSSPLFDEDPTTAPWGFGSSDARDLTSRRDVGEWKKNGVSGSVGGIAHPLCFAPLCRTAEEACFGFDFLSPRGGESIMRSQQIVRPQPFGGDKKNSEVENKNDFDEELKDLDLNVIEEAKKNDVKSKAVIGLSMAF